MAHFAELNESNVVLRVVVIGNADTSDANGVEKEHIGLAFCERMFGGTWKQTSYNGNFRKQYAPIGGTYDSVNDVFISPQPFPSWTLNETFDWTPPIPMPDDAKSEENIDGRIYQWDEEVYQADNTQGWIVNE